MAASPIHFVDPAITLHRLVAASPIDFVNPAITLHRLVAAIALWRTIHAVTTGPTVVEVIAALATTILAAHRLLWHVCFAMCAASHGLTRGCLAMADVHDTAFHAAVRRVWLLHVTVHHLVVFLHACVHGVALR